jgi:zinc transport system permease protein
MLELIISNFDKLIFPLLVGSLLALTASILGVVLVLKRYSMIGDGLSHVTFGVFAIT